LKVESTRLRVVRRLIVLALALAPIAQTSTPVTIDVTVAGRTAASVANLSAAEFEVEFDGRTQVVRAAEMRPAGAATEMAGAVGPVFEAAPMPPSAVYRLSIDVPGLKADAAINVRLRRGDLNVLSARRAAATAPPSSPAPAAAAGPVEDRLRDAVARGRASTGFPLAVGHSVRRASDSSQITLEIAIDIPAATPGPISTLLGIVDARGAIRSVSRTLEAEKGGGPYRLDLALPLPPATYKLRIAAADAKGTVTSVELPMNAQLGQIGGMARSDLLRMTGDAADRRRAITDDAVPADAVTLFLAMELYAPAAGAPPDLLVNMSLTQEGASTPAAERIVTPELREGALVAEAEFGLQRLLPGRYVARAVVLSGARPLGAIEALVKR
jgi:hypothetical protein